MQSTTSYLSRRERAYQTSLQWANFLANAARLEDHSEIAFEELSRFSEPDDFNDMDLVGMNFGGASGYEVRNNDNVNADVNDDINADNDVNNDANDDNDVNDDANDNANDDNDFTEDDDEVEDFVVDVLIDEMPPNLEQLRRRWRESGMDRVLDVFDIDIAYNGGEWVRINRMQNQENGDRLPVEVVQPEENALGDAP